MGFLYNVGWIKLKEMTKVIDPQFYVAISYDTLYEDGNKIDPKSFLTDVSMYDALYFIAQRINSINYSFTDVSRQRLLIYEMRCYFIDESEWISKIDCFLSNYELCYLFENESFFIYEMIVLQFANSLKTGLTNIDIKNIYKAYLYSCKIWIDMQACMLEKSSDIQEYSIRLDLPIVEFKTYKDFRIQLYKAIQFFKFCEKDELFNNYLKFFLEDNQCKSYIDYLSRLVILYQDCYNNIEIKDMSKYGDFLDIFKRFLISTEDCKLLFDKRDMVYVRNHILFQHKDKIIILNPNLLVDKFYQGMIFDFWTSVKNHKGKNARGKEISEFVDFRSLIGMRFSECELFYSVLSNSFNTEEYIMIPGTEIKELNTGTEVVGEPDYYMRRGNCIFLFEFKDLTLAESLKKSNSFKNIRDSILARLCKEGECKRKGAIQILYVINRFYNKTITLEINREISPSDTFFPILVTTDRSFDALGINSMIIQEFSQIAEERYNHLAGRVKMPIIINIDTLVDLMYRLHMGKINFESLLLDYLSIYDNGLYSRKAMISFSSFVYDYYKIDPLSLRDENRYLYGAFLDEIKHKREYKED